MSSFSWGDQKTYQTKLILVEIFVANNSVVITDATLHLNSASYTVKLSYVIMLSLKHNHHDRIHLYFFADFS